MFKTTNILYLSALVTCLAGLAACGGAGGESGGSAAQSSGSSATGGTYPLQQAYASLKAAGFQQSVNVTGTATVNGIAIPVTGSLLVSQNPASTTTFDGQTAQETTTSVSGTVSAEGQSIVVSDSSNAFVSATGQPLGETTNDSYCVDTSYTALPTSINVGASGPFATFVCYTDSTMSTELGTVTSTYTVAAGATSNTAMLEIVVTGSNAQGQQTSNAQTNFQMDSSGKLTFSSVSVTTTIAGMTVTYSS